MKRTLVLGLAVSLLVSPAAALSADAVPSPAPPGSSIIGDARAGMQKLVDKSTANDHVYFTQGNYRYIGTQCARCELGPSVAAAALYRRTGDKGMRYIALRGMDTAINSRSQADGSWGSKNQVGGNGLDTLFFAEHLGMFLHAMGPTLDAGRRAKYMQVLARATDTFVDQNTHTYAINGNINVAITVLYGMTWHFTKNPKYHQVYDDSLGFTLDPGPENPGYGLRLTARGSRSLGRDSAGYLAERGPGGLGYDPNYTQFQADLAAQGYVVTGDPRLLTLTNELNNQLLGRVNTQTWWLDISNGTRHTAGNRKDPFLTPALLVSAENGRPELANLAVAQARAASAFFNADADNVWNHRLQSWGTQMATLIMVAP